MVVIVEEQQSTLGSLVRMTRRATGGLVLGFHDYEEAFNSISRAQIQVLVVSAGDDKAPGVDLIRKIRALPDAQKVWVIATSTEAWPQTQRAALIRAGADCTIGKPYDFDSLLTALANGLTLTASTDILLLSAGAESPGLDFKERIHLDSADARAAIAKDVIAMSNYGGGKIIVGVAEPSRGTFHPAGIPAEEIASYETTVFNKAVRDFMQPHIPVECRSITHEGRTFKVLTVPGSDTVILAARENTRAGLFPGRVYVRTASAESSEIRTATEMRALLDRIVQLRIEAAISKQTPSRSPL